MSLTKNKIIGIIAVLVIALQIAYVFTVYNNQLQDINELNVSISKKEKEIETLQQKLQALPELEAKLEKAILEKNALIAQIPGSYSTAKDFSNIMDIAQANGLGKVDVQTEEVTIDQLGDYQIKEKRYKLVYMSSYGQSESFIRNLNRSYQTIQLSDLIIDNGPQGNQEYMAASGYKGNGRDFVQTELKFIMFTNPTKPDEELYDAGSSIVTNSDEPFYKMDATPSDAPVDTSALPEGTPSVGETIQPDLTMPARTSVGPSVFTLNLADILTSGDNFQFSGPGPTTSVYAGMRSPNEGFVTLTIREDSYDIVIEDSSGKVSQNSAIIRLGDLSMQINASIAKIKENMSNVHVYVNNYSSRNISVRLVGQGKEYVKIYNSLGQQVLPGQTLGKVSLVSP